ncbi:RING/U-box superfamily protein [Raphanus sativus]|uniref:Uncharacterized protein LOC108834947 n=1 Tax=Raphanus sativus TaxID=3726 RepID=A0A6J0LV99_RAPSA|nr:uncharacterized protein LOC108834947 [Raphanus sativus]XP_056863452.1 uncharacterized protein LOC108834947 [Raphanus sativus]KAJ4915741.1 RING/U-box superfamily protein [Raphanus sativus]
MGSLCCVAAKSDRPDSASRDFSFGPHEPYWRTNTSFSPPSSRWDVPGASFYGSSTSSNANLLPSPDLSQTLHCSFSSCSDDIGDSETNRNFSNRRFFLSKPVHPMEAVDACSWSSGTTTSSIDSMEAVLDWDNNHNSTKPQRAASSIFRCGLCDRYISQKSPCGSRSIVRNRDMPVTGVLPCQHVFHAECLEGSTPKAHRSDPPCPICIKQKGEQSSKSHNIVLRLKPFCEDRQWACAQVGDCVESAVYVPPRNTMVMINRNRMRRNLSLRGSSSKDYPRKIKKSSSFMETFTNQVSLVHSSRGKEKV